MADCSICWGDVVDRAVLYPCLHSQYCFECIERWMESKASCPLCVRTIEYVMHDIKGDDQYLVHRKGKAANTQEDTHRDLEMMQASSGSSRSRIRRQPRRYERYGVRGEMPSDNLNLERRKILYDRGLYAKHVGSNKYTRFRHFDHRQVTRDPRLKQKLAMFVRRELMALKHPQVEFVTHFVILLASQMDIVSTPAAELLADFLEPHIARHLAHEVTMFARSPFTTLHEYDRYAQYDLGDVHSVNPSRAPRQPPSTPDRNGEGRLERTTKLSSKHDTPSNSLSSRAIGVDYSAPILSNRRISNGTANISTISKSLKTSMQHTSFSREIPISTSRHHQIYGSSCHNLTTAPASTARRHSRSRSPPIAYQDYNSTEREQQLKRILLTRKAGK